MIYIFLIIIAMVTQHVIAWAGSTLNSVGSSESYYAVFTFSDDRYLPMTTNVLMNIFMPNVILVFLFLIIQKLNWSIVTWNLMIYTVAVYVYRFILICIILRRKELYSPIYELIIASVGITVSFVLCKYFFRQDNTIILTVDEMREELWIAILFVIYKFMKQVLDKKIKQNDVLKKRQLEQYIIHKFEKFFKKYNELFTITENNRYMCIFTYAVMIFEDYNRGPWLRWMERQKVKFGKKATVGIMQVTSELPLSDDESVIQFFEWVKQNSIDERDISNREEEAIEALAWENNNDTDYAKSVVYIFDCLYEFIYSRPKYRKIFYLKNFEDSEDREEIDEKKSAQMEVIQWMMDNPGSTPEQVMQYFGLSESV